MTIEEQLAIAKDVLEQKKAYEARPEEERWTVDGHLDSYSQRSKLEVKFRIALHNHAPAILEGWVRAVEHCKQAQLMMAYNDRAAGERDAYKHILAILTTPEESNDAD